MGPPRPQRRVSDHVHEQYWTETDHDKYESRVEKELHELRADVKSFSHRFAWLMGALAVLVFLANAFSIYALRVLLPPGGQ